ncbi:pyridoxamine 5'-phosphate oxidase family protein [Bowmanella sp. Y26]|uniref:pyridoxamine 5'-phosphate oxidase family protein n=1 Tax=Bowmanella yangjiangensis TaxID=2811230 RepID=UPI001BDC865F|nr:pyridoxamine 5'-phosphate oxidase family protein [Bowmanella yangjiangensis]MBT1062355.1 pyridoxamine 5'-phosphate oxidase family protein [Bowmanella yangjiangensis]
MQAPSQRTQVKRGRKRADYDPLLVKQIIDQSLLCHVAQIHEGYPVVTPTCHWRDGDMLYWHGHARARNVYASQGQSVCVNISQLDGLVLARSAFHHSVNYRSVTLFGVPQLIEDEVEKRRQLELFVERLSPGRWQQLRPINEQEMMLTAVVAIPINEASVKVRSAPPSDDDEDYGWPVWAGVMPIQRQWGVLQQDPLQTENMAYPLPLSPANGAI